MHRYSNPRDIVVKYAGPCRCCGATIKAGDLATYYPDLRAIAHVGGLDGNSARCAATLADKAVNNLAGDGLDSRWEDQGAEICGR